MRKLGMATHYKSDAEEIQQTYANAVAQAEYCSAIMNEDAQKLLVKASAQLEEFDADLYRSRYPDLQSYTEDEAYIHWVTHGCTEGRSIR